MGQRSIIRIDPMRILRLVYRAAELERSSMATVFHGVIFRLGLWMRMQRQILIFNYYIHCFWEMAVDSLYIKLNIPEWNEDFFPIDILIGSHIVACEYFVMTNILAKNAELLIFKDSIH